MPRTIRVHRANNHFQHAEVLRRNRQRRQQYGEFFLEGVRPINLALEHDWTITAYYYAPALGLSDWAKGLLARSRADLHVELTPSLMAALSGKTDTSELIALAPMPQDDLSRIPVREDLLVVAFDRPASPGNLGTLIRSCDALHAGGLIVLGHSADLYDPETISASRGSLFALPTVRLGGIREMEPWLEEIKQKLDSLRLVGSDEHGTTDVWQADLAGPTVLFVGNETWGLSAGLRERCDELVRIPIGGSASSLNVACAASIMLYEIERQRVLRRVDGP
jgi:TrmH family RNA methyltransferase